MSEGRSKLVENELGGQIIERKLNELTARWNDGAVSGIFVVYVGEEKNEVSFFGGKDHETLAKIEVALEKATKNFKESKAGIKQ